MSFKTIYVKRCLNREDAKQRGRYLKTATSRRFLAQRLKQYKSSYLI